MQRIIPGNPTQLIGVPEKWAHNNRGEENLRK